MERLPLKHMFCCVLNESFHSFYIESLGICILDIPVSTTKWDCTYVRTYSVLYTTYYVHTVRISTRVLRDHPREQGFPGVKKMTHMPAGHLPGVVPTWPMPVHARHVHAYNFSHLLPVIVAWLNDCTKGTFWRRSSASARSGMILVSFPTNIWSRWTYRHK